VVHASEGDRTWRVTDVKPVAEVAPVKLPPEPDEATEETFGVDEGPPK
jgi:hypothetical protein